MLLGVTELLSKVSGAVWAGIVMVLIIAVLAFVVVYQKSEIAEQRTDIVLKDRDIKEYKDQVTNQKTIKSATTNSVKKTQERTTETRNSTKEVLSKLEKLESQYDAQTNAKVVDTPLPADVVSLLAEHCARVHGSPCPNP
jgi:septal ring factor EnvC (AmiA/AmiB activator)